MPTRYAVRIESGHFYDDPKDIIFNEDGTHANARIYITDYEVRDGLSQEDLLKEKKQALYRAIDIMREDDFEAMIEFMSRSAHHKIFPTG